MLNQQMPAEEMSLFVIFCKLVTKACVFFFEVLKVWWSIMLTYEIPGRRAVILQSIDECMAEYSPMFRLGMVRLWCKDVIWLDKLTSPAPLINFETWMSRLRARLILTTTELLPGVFSRLCRDAFELAADGRACLARLQQRLRQTALPIPPIMVLGQADLWGPPKEPSHRPDNQYWDM